MQRERDFDDEDDDTPLRTSPKGFPRYLLALVVLGLFAGIIVVAGAAAVIVVATRSKATKPEPMQVEHYTPGTMPTRPEPVLKLPAVPSLPIPSLPPLVTVNPSADREGKDWTVEELAAWLKANKRIVDWEPASGGKALLKIDRIHNETLAKYPGAISAEEAARPISITAYEGPDFIASMSVVWGQFVVRKCGHVIGRKLFLGLKGARIGDYTPRPGYVDTPTTVPIEESLKW